VPQYRRRHLRWAFSPAHLQVRQAVPCLRLLSTANVWEALLIEAELPALIHAAPSAPNPRWLYFNPPHPSDVQWWQAPTGLCGHAVLARSGPSTRMAGLRQGCVMHSI
jgi:hypothetical protein